MKKKAIALITVASGLAFSFLITVTGSGASPNYAVTSMMNQLVGLCIMASLGFILGCFIGASLPWLLSKTETSHNPYFVTGGSAIGALIGFVINTFLLSIIFRMFHNSRFFSLFNQILRWLIPLALAYVGAYLATRIECKPPKKLLPRFAWTSLGVLFFLWLLHSSMHGCGRLSGVAPQNDFPASGSMEVRHNWALNKFMNYYPKAVEMVRHSEVIQKDAGKMIAIAPAVNADNYFTKAPGDPGLAVFTLDVQGDKGTGICRISLSKNNGDLVNGERTLGVSNFDWEFGGKKMPLTKEGRFDKSRFELTQQIQQQKEAMENLKRLFKERKFQEFTEAQSAAKKAGINISSMENGKMEILLMSAQAYESLGDKKAASAEYTSLAWFDKRHADFEKKHYGKNHSNYKTVRGYLDKAKALDPLNPKIEQVLAEIEGNTQP